MRNRFKYRPLIERFEEKYIPEPMSGCWIWIGSCNPDGYGMINVSGKTDRAHRVSYRLFKGEIPKGICVCHSCDKSYCCNPQHLFLGTHKENMEDRAKKVRTNASLTHCKRGHELSGYNLMNRVYKKTGKKYRNCRTCKQLYERNENRPPATV